MKLRDAFDSCFNFTDTDQISLVVTLHTYIQKVPNLYLGQATSDPD